jgi:GNAT superfamily N-acetyltransferase
MRRPAAGGDHVFTMGNELTRQCRTEVKIREIRPHDATELRAFHARLSPESRRRRFLGTSSDIGEGQAASFAGAAARDSAGFVATRDGRIVGHAVVERTRPHAVEMAFAVDDAWQRRGIGRALLARSVDWARAHGIERLELELFADNLAMRRLLRSVPEAHALAHGDGSVTQVELVLPGTLPTAA